MEVVSEYVNMFSGIEGLVIERSINAVHHFWLSFVQSDFWSGRPRAYSEIVLHGILKGYWNETALADNANTWAWKSSIVELH